MARQERGGCSGLLRCGKATTFEGMKTPSIYVRNWEIATSENMNNNEFLPGCYTDLTFEAESGSIHSAPNRKSQDFFRGFYL